MGIPETLQRNWDELSPRDRKGLMKRIDQPFPDSDIVDDMGPELRGRLLIALRDGGQGFSVEEYQRGKDANTHSSLRPGPLGTKLRDLSNRLDKFIYPHLHDEVTTGNIVISRLFVALGNIH